METEEWLDWNDEKFFEVLLKEFPKLDTHMTENIISDTTKRLESIKLDIDYSKEMSEMKYINDINVILRETGIAAKANKEQLNSMIKLLIKNIDDRQKDRTSDGEVYKQLTMHLRALGKIESIKMLLIEISKWVAIKRKIYNEAVLLFNLKKVTINNPNTHTSKHEAHKAGGGHVKNRKERRAEMFKNNPTTVANVIKKQLCDGCGRDNHLKANCELQPHPDWNKSGRWEDSEAAKTLAKGITVNGENKTFKTLQFSLRLNGSKVDPPVEYIITVCPIYYILVQ
jgi:hypothetical protein